MTRRRFLASSLAIAMGAPAWARASSEEIVVIAHRSQTVAALSRAELRAIFQTVKREWPDGKTITPLNLPEDHPLRRHFDDAVLGLDPEQVARYWIDRRIRGGERPPRRAASPAVALRAVASDPSAISYVAAGDADRSVRVVARIRGREVLAP